ncbi:hypothetical protein J8273_8504 [Carpediemonas membranifera]|uniref:Uncharacterized protein n=1 Tax=Carpediemonas membranifera TaxID=201153 RepID=A0A8J6AQX1_9EUKA|nr:hypothetical protein J8273_8504 [Carpediemonas membranifera]|eukprot:KAG9389825.1 hypothetical protein J8273_8504 [Carpediemonas membranifera]
MQASFQQMQYLMALCHQRALPPSLRREYFRQLLILSKRSDISLHMSVRLRFCHVCGSEFTGTIAIKPLTQTGAKEAFTCCTLCGGKASVSAKVKSLPPNVIVHPQLSTSQAVDESAGAGQENGGMGQPENTASVSQSVHVSVTDTAAVPQHAPVAKPCTPPLQTPAPKRLSMFEMAMVSRTQPKPAGRPVRGRGRGRGRRGR